VGWGQSASNVQKTLPVIGSSKNPLLLPSTDLHQQQQHTHTYYCNPHEGSKVFTHSFAAMLQVHSSFFFFFSWVAEGV
jgi:hypothetical protein